MKSLRRYLARLTNIVAGRRKDERLNEEIEEHIALQTAEYLRVGLPPGEARRQAVLKFGAVEAIKEDYRAERGMPFIDTLHQDLHYGLRMLCKSPGFTAIAILTLALGIGANSAIFSVVNGVLLRPLPYPEPERLLTIQSSESLLDLEDIQRQSQSFDALGASTMQRLDYTGGAEPIQIFSINCNADIFRALRTQPALGRLLNADDDRYGAPGAVILSHGFWMRQFGDDPNIIGKSIPLSGNSYTIVGVLPPDFWLPGPRGDVYASLRVVYPAAAQARGVHFLRTYLRLKPGVTLSQAQSEMDRTNEFLARAYPDYDKNRHRRLMPLLENVVGDSRAALLILFGAVGLVLLIACVNFANLLLARGASRRREIAIRTALGAGLWRLIAQMLTESLLLALAGGAGGILLAQAGIRMLIAFAPDNVPRLGAIDVDAGVLVFTLTISVLTGILFGLFPAWSAARLTLGEGLKESGRTTAGSRTSLKLRQTLVVSEAVLATLVLVGAGLLVRSFQRMQSVSPGFRPDNILTMRLELPESRYEETAKQIPFRTHLLDSLNSLPGVQAAMISELPMSGDYLDHDLTIEGRPVKIGEEPEVQTRTILGDYFSIMSIPLLRGREFSTQDREDTPVVVVVNETFVRRLFPNHDPIGARIRWSRDDPASWKTIVGVVGDVKHFGLDQSEEPAVYDLYSQTQEPWKRWMSLAVRSARDPGDLTREVEAQIWALDRGLPPTSVLTMKDVMDASLTPRKFNLTLMSIFAAVALALAVIGIYGVVTYSVTQRTHEIGIRLALGAQQRDVAWLVLGEGARLAVLGAIFGLTGAAALTPFMASLLFGVGVRDPLAFISVAGILICVAAAACWIPARRAMRVDPMQALREE
ncbi:MAG: ABC transporter permease [Candidatus Acidiferrales bacterium]|jgi:predicted permease